MSKKRHTCPICGSWEHSHIECPMVRMANTERAEDYSYLDGDDE